MEKKHFLLISVPGYGHTIPMVGLARKLSIHHQVTFVICKAALEHIRAKREITPEDDQSFRVVGLEDGIAPANTDDLITIASVMQFQDNGRPALERLIKEVPVAGQPLSGIAEKLYDITSPVNAVIADVLTASGLTGCVERKLRYYLLICSSIGPFRSMLYVTERTPVANADNLETFVVLRPESEGPQPGVVQLMQDMGLSINQFLSTANGILVNSFREIEQQFIEEVKQDHRMSRLEYYCVGPFMPEETVAKPSISDLNEKVSRWLDCQADNSVVYVSFGSVALPNEIRIKEVCNALKILNKPFIFSLRQVHHGSLPEEMRTGIDTQFSDSVAIGLVLHWAPQKVILCHRSTAVFVSHCGWNSTIESIFHGKPIVGWPIFGDQLENALWMEEVGLGESLIRLEGARDVLARRSITGVYIAAMLKRVGFESDKIRETAGMWKKRIRTAVAPGGISHLELQEFIKSVPE